MESEDRAEIEATQAALEALMDEGCTLTGDALLNLATERAGYDVDTTRVEQCAACGVLYHADYGGEYVDPFDHADLQRELRIRGMRKLYYKHFCDFQCLREAAYAVYRPY